MFSQIKFNSVFTDEESSNDLHQDYEYYLYMKVNLTILLDIFVKRLVPTIFRKSIY